MPLKDLLERLRGALFRTQGRPHPASGVKIPQASSPTPGPKSGVAAPASKPAVRKQPVVTQKQERHLVVGLDFGTSCTKIVFRDQADRRSIAVPLWRPPNGRNPYLLPSIVSMDARGAFSLGAKGGERTIRDPKMLLMDSPAGSFSVDGFGPIPTQALATAFLALALQQYRRWFEQEKSGLYRGMDLIWELNLGIPARSFDTTEVLEAYRRVAAAAAILSKEDSAPSIHSVGKALDDVRAFYRCGGPASQGTSKDFGSFGADSIHLRPEIIAGVLGYARSPLRKEGLYLMVDVGAGTLDVSTFRIFEREGEDSFPIFTSEVAPLGAYRLHCNRVAAVKARLSDDVLRRLDAEVQAEGPLPALLDYAPDLNRKQLMDADLAFMSQCERLVSKVVCATRRDRDYNAPEWSRGLPVFLCGGGSRLHFYKSVLEKVERIQAQSFNYPPRSQPFLYQQLPQPTDLVAPGAAPGDFDRLSVAYGLSFSELNIGKVQVPSQIDDMPKPQLIRSSVEDRYVGKEMT